MNLIRNGRGLASRSIWLLLWFAPMWAASAAPKDGHEEKFNVLQTKTRSYTNVTVTTRARSYIFIVHAGGMENVQVSDLTPEVLETLGYAVDVKEKRSVISTLPVLARSTHAGSAETPARTPRLPPLNLPPWLRSMSTFLMVILGIVLAVYLFFCYCLSLICRKAGSPAGILIWLPVLQWIPMIRAAGMSGAWLLMVYAPVFAFVAVLLLLRQGTPYQTLSTVMLVASVLHILGRVAWYFNIVKAREKSLFVALLLLLPITNVLAFLYLAFSGVESSEKAPKKYESMALETA